MWFNYSSQLAIIHEETWTSLRLTRKMSLTQGFQQKSLFSKLTSAPLYSHLNPLKWTNTLSSLALAKQEKQIKLRVCSTRTRKLLSIKSLALPQPKRRLPTWIWLRMTVSQSILACPLPELMTIFSKNHLPAGFSNLSILVLRKGPDLPCHMGVRIMMRNSSKYIWNKFKRLSYVKLKNVEPKWRMSINQILILRKTLCGRMWRKCCLKRT